jgi:hypothetical protein
LVAIADVLPSAFCFRAVREIKTWQAAVFQILSRAAQNRQSRAAVAAVATVFSAPGKPKGAATAPAQMRNDWPDESNHPADVLVTSC